MLWKDPGGKPVGHAFYVLDPTRLEAMALNQEDNGFPQHTRTVREVLERNEPKYLWVTPD